VVESDYWIGGDETPTAEGEYSNVWQWETTSDSPCLYCTSRQGDLFPYQPNYHPANPDPYIGEPPAHPGHPFCSCRLLPLWLPAHFDGRIQTGIDTEYWLEYIGLVPGNGSRSWTVATGQSGQVSFVAELLELAFGTYVERGETIQLSNEYDSQLEAYAVWRITTTHYVDKWVLVVAGPDEDRSQEVKHVVTEFVTLTTNPQEFGG
jgi:hypothetical protein